MAPSTGTSGWPCQRAVSLGLAHHLAEHGPVQLLPRHVADQGLEDAVAAAQPAGQVVHPAGVVELDALDAGKRGIGLGLAVAEQRRLPQRLGPRSHDARGYRRQAGTGRAGGAQPGWQAQAEPHEPPDAEWLRRPARSRRTPKAGARRRRGRSGRPGARRPGSSAVGRRRRCHIGGSGIRTTARPEPTGARWSGPQPARGA